MNADQISRALQSTRDSAGIHKLRSEVTSRQTEIRDRIAAIHQSENMFFPSPKARLEAVAKGPDAVSKLDTEIASLNTELNYVAELERQIYAEFEAAETREIAAAIPRCLRNLPSATQKVRDALKKLDEEMAALRAAVETIGDFDRAGIKFPLTDAECAELLQLRLDVWEPRTVATVTPPGLDVNSMDQFPLSWPLAFKKHAPGAYSRRLAPQARDLLDTGAT